MNSVSGTIQWARRCYGIDFQGGVPVVVCSDRSKGEEGFLQVSLKDEKVIDDLKKGVPCAASLSSRESLMCRVKAPFDSSSKARKVFPTLLDIQLPFPLEDCAYEFLDQKPDNGAITALAVAGRGKDIEAKLAVLSEAGVDPYVLDYEGLALWTQTLKEIPVSAEVIDEWRAVINLNGKASSLAVGRGTEFLSFHSISGDNAGQINRLVKSCIASSGGSSDNPAGKIHWVWTGPGASRHEDFSDLRSGLDVFIEGHHSFVDKPEIFLARALSSRALFPGPLRCNLRKGGIVHGGAISRSRRRFAASIALFLLSGIILCVSNVFIQGLMTKKKKIIDGQFYAAANEAAGYDIRGLRGEHVVREVRTQIARQKQLLAPFLEFAETSMLDVLSAIMAISKDADYTLDAVQFDREEVMISGTAPGWEAFDDLLKYLVKQGYQVTEDNIDRKDALEDGRIPFRIMSGRVR